MHLTYTRDYYIPLTMVDPKFMELHLTYLGIKHNPKRQKAKLS